MKYPVIWVGIVVGVGGIRGDTLDIVSLDWISDIALESLTALAIVFAKTVIAQLDLALCHL